MKDSDWVGIGLGAIVALFIIVITGFSTGTSIISIEGYEHGVIICGEVMTINSGHYEDEEVGRLINKAKEECNE